MVKETLRCGKCKFAFSIDTDNIDKNLEFMQCPICQNITKNPYYKLKGGYD